MDFSSDFDLPFLSFGNLRFASSSINNIKKSFCRCHQQCLLTSALERHNDDDKTKTKKHNAVANTATTTASAKAEEEDRFTVRMDGYAT
jgi:hypothetical protein